MYNSRSPSVLRSPQILEGTEAELLKIGGYWYKLDGCYTSKRRWVCARGCGARLHTVGKRVVFTELRHFCRTNNYTI
uniref:SFRICE_001928 n=1 Tax=Spodoptera frugiperda TaxID=7108 RepID=A0A2H1W253_SPOFR